MPAEIGIEDGVLQDGSYFFSKRRCGWLAEPGEFTPGGIDDTHEHSQRRGFAAAVRPQHPKDFSLSYFEVELVHGAKAAEVFCKSFDGENCFQDGVI